MATDGFDLRRDFFRVARRRAFDEQFGEQGRRAVVLRCLGEDTALEHGAKFHEGQARIFLHQQLQPVRQVDLLDGMIGIGLHICL